MGVAFALVQSFGVDGELAAMGREECFSLGVEWGIAWQLAKGAVPFSLMVHGENSDRIGAMLETQGRKFSVVASRGWATITVASLD